MSFTSHLYDIPVILFLTLQCIVNALNDNLPVFINDMNLALIKEDTAIGTAIYQLHGESMNGLNLRYGLKGTDLLRVNESTGIVSLAKNINYETTQSLSINVTLEEIDTDFQPKNKVEVPVNLVILDVNDNSPKFSKESYDIFMTEETLSNSTVLKVEVIDADVVGTPLNISCRSIPQFPSVCDLFQLSVINTSNRNITGNLILKKQLLYSQYPFFQFLLSSSDGVHQAERPVTVFVSPTRVPPPEITGPFFAIINESLPLGSLVMRVNAKIPSRVKGRLAYSLLSNPHQLFGINSNTGEIKTAKVIDSESLINPVVNLKIQVQVNEDGRQVTEYTPMTSAVDIQIAIKDINDNPPLFSQQEVIVHCPENAHNGYILKKLNLIVKDPDVTKSTLLLMFAEETKYFELEPKSVSDGWAAITIKLQNGPLDYENLNHQNFTLKIIASEDSTDVKLSSTATVNVYIDDVNDNSPHFQLTQYTVTVNESAQTGTLIATITADDTDGTNYGSSSIIYTLQGLEKDLFWLNETSGGLHLSNSTGLDFESNRVYHFTYVATDNYGRGLIATIPLAIYVADVNDNPPLFSKTQYTGSIRKGEIDFSPPLIVQAIDKDTVSKIAYQIVSGNDNSLFTINNETGELKPSNSSGLFINPDIDSNRFNLIIQAIDGEIYAVNVSVLIEILRSEDDLPVFQNNIYNSSISEMAIPGTFVQQVSAKVGGYHRSNIIYQIIRGGCGKFKIGKSNGVVTVAKGAQFDFDKQKQYHIEIMAEDDSVSPPTNAITLLNVHLEDVNNKPPVIVPMLQTAQVFENAKLGDVVHVIKATDPDAFSTNALKFFIANETQSYLNRSFDLDENSGEIKVAGVLSRREQSETLISVLIVDTSAPIPQTATGAVLVTIMKINKMPPTFPLPWTPQTPNLSISIVEEQPVGSIVYTFIAIDSDSDIGNYTLTSDNNLFEINKASGVLITKNRVDYEKVQEVTFTIVATDTGVPQLSATAVVTATIVNINDNDPVFNKSNYATSIKEHSAVNTHVVTVSASDKDFGDFGRVNYKLLGDQREAFTVDTNGVVLVKDSELLDRELTTTVTFYVLAEDIVNDDSQQPRSASVPIVVTLLDINDHGPKFNQKEYFVSVMDNIYVFPPTPILQMTAKDDDDNMNGLIAYSIIDGNNDGIFIVNSVSGMLFPNVSLIGQSRQHIIKVIARDVNGTGPNYDLTTVTIEVLQVNSNAPRIVAPSIKNSTIYVEENNVGDGYVICTIFADDPDDGKNGNVQYYIKNMGNNVLETELFSMNSHSGQLRLNGPLDRELQSKHSLIIVAKDNGIPRPYETLQQILVVVKDVNDNEPYFIRSQFTNPYTFEIKENLQVGALVGQIEAFDRDSEDISNIYYYLISADENEVFAVDKLTGSIYTNHSLDFELRKNYHLVIKATNYPTEPKVKTCKDDDSSCVRVVIYVIDENDNAPTFLQMPYVAGLYFEAQIGQIVIDSSAYDPDQEDQGTLIYSIEKTTLFSPGTRDSAKVMDKTPFSINNKGHVIVETAVNVYKYDHFKLVIQCKEAAISGKSASTTLEIWIYDKDLLTKMTIDKYIENVKLNRQILSSELSNLTEGTAVVAEMKEFVTIDLEKDDFNSKTELGILVIDTKKRAVKPIRDVIASFSYNSNRLQSHFRLLSPLQSAVGDEYSKDHDNLVLGALVALITVLFIGLILTTITIKCIKRILRHKTQIVNLRRETFEPPITTENPLWIDQISRAYEEQEIGLSVHPGQLETLPGGSNTTDGANATSSNEAMYATIRRNARSARENLRTMEENVRMNHDPIDWNGHTSTLQRENYHQQHRNVCHVSPTYLPPPISDDYCQSGIL